MKLAVSQIAWAPEEEDAAFELLARCGVAWLEAVPARLWHNLVSASLDAADATVGRLRACGLGLAAFQALYFGVEGARLFGSAAERAVCETHLAGLIPVAGRAGARALVFGAPVLRRVPEGMMNQEAVASAREFFSPLARTAEKAGVYICLEPNPSVYGTNFLTSLDSTAELVREMASPGCRLQLDTGALAINGEDPRRAVRDHLQIVGHIHLSEAQLSDFSAPWAGHRELAAALHGAGYDGFVSIEMKRAPRGLAAVEEAIAFVRDVYGAT